MKPTEETFRDRINAAARANEQYKKKVHRLRGLVAGDNAVLSSTTSSDDYEGIRPFEPEYADYLVTDVEAGRANKMFQAIRTLVNQVSYVFPDIEFSNVEPEEATLNAEYCRIRLGSEPTGCNARHHMRLALLDYLTGGMGWAFVGTDTDSRPLILNADTLDVEWDMSARIPQDIRWASCAFRNPRWYWEEMFSRSALPHVNADTPDEPIELVFYYDVIGKGNWCIFQRIGGREGLHEKPVYKGSNPYYRVVGGEKLPTLPVESMYHLTLPSVRLPVGVAEAMTPQQIAIWESDRHIQRVINGAKAFYAVQKGALSPDNMAKFEAGEIGAIVEIEHGHQAPQYNPSGEVDRTTLEWRNQNEQELVAQSGANPYASGNKVDGVKYAAEVNAIQGASGLMAATVAKDNAEFWERVVRKVLEVGSAFDRAPFAARIDRVLVEFDEADSIRQYLRPDAELTIREQSMQFEPAEARIARAKAKLDVAMAMAKQFPGGVAQAYEEVLKAMGEKNISKYLDAPQADSSQLVNLTAA